jgi:hypothetical protein
MLGGTIEKVVQLFTDEFAEMVATVVGRCGERNCKSTAVDVSREHISYSARCPGRQRLNWPAEDTVLHEANVDRAMVEPSPRSKLYSY